MKSAVVVACSAGGGVVISGRLSTTLTLYATLHAKQAASDWGQLLCFGKSREK